MGQRLYNDKGGSDMVSDSCAVTDDCGSMKVHLPFLFETVVRTAIDLVRAPVIEEGGDDF